MESETDNTKDWNTVSMPQYKRYTLWRQILAWFGFAFLIACALGVFNYLVSIIFTV